jgi:putative chitinase
MISDDMLKQIMPHLSGEKRADYISPLQAAMTEFEITTPIREAAFLAQIAHESAELTVFVENLNYRADRLLEVWPRLFPDPPTAAPFGGNPEKLANYVYANKIGNGDEASGDGWRFRGRGAIQITGRDNYAKYGSMLNLDLVNNPDQAATPVVGFRTAGLYWRENGLNELADADMIETITYRINKRKEGLKDRITYYTRAKQALGVPASRDVLQPESERGVPLPPEFTRASELVDDQPPIRPLRVPTKRRAVRSPSRATRKKISRKKMTRTRTARRVRTKKSSRPAKRRVRSGGRRK